MPHQVVAKSTSLAQAYSLARPLLTDHVSTHWRVPTWQRGADAVRLLQKPDPWRRVDALESCEEASLPLP